MLAVATGIQASDFVVDELCYNITDAEAKTVEVAKYDYTVDGEMVRPTKMDVVVPTTIRPTASRRSAMERSPSMA